MGAAESAIKRQGLQFTDAFKILFHVKFKRQAGAGHVAYFPENRSFAPSAVVHAADAPGNAGISVGVTTVQQVAVVEVNGGF